VAPEIDIPLGSPAADQTRPSPSGSVALGDNDALSPTSLLRFPRTVRTGGRFVSAITHWNETSDESGGTPSSTTVRVTGYRSPSAYPRVPLMLPVLPASMEAIELPDQEDDDADRQVALEHHP